MEDLHKRQLSPCTKIDDVRSNIVKIKIDEVFHVKVCRFVGRRKVVEICIVTWRSINPPTNKVVGLNIHCSLFLYYINVYYFLLSTKRVRGIMSTDRWKLIIVTPKFISIETSPIYGIFNILSCRLKIDSEWNLIKIYWYF